MPDLLVVDAKPAPGDASTGSGTAMAPFMLPVLIGGLLAKLVTPTVGLGAFVAVIVVLVVLKKPDEGRFVLRVSEKTVEIARERPRAGTASVRLALDDILDVTLDRQTSQMSGRAATERVRLALERRAPETPIFVPEERITPIEAQEWLAKVRVFLRNNGWVPESERT